MNAPRSYERKPLSNLLNSPGRVVPPELGEPLGDIGMKTQLWDAQRLVRVVLGNASSDQPLEPGSILKAIRTFALMKAELTQLRQQQDHLDPPAILPLMTPSTCQTNLFPDATPQKEAQHVKDATPTQAVPTPPAAEIHRRGLIEAARKIQSLEHQLATTTKLMTKLQEQLSEKDDLLTRAKEDKAELKEQLRAHKDRFSLHKEHTNKSKEQKDFLIYKLRNANQQMREDMTQAMDDLEQLELHTTANQTGPELKKEIAKYTKEQQSILSTLKGKMGVSLEGNDSNDGAERLKQLKSEHEAMVSTIRMIEDCSFGLL